jgi:hypothetical protein
MLGFRPVVPTLLCGRYKAEIVGAVVNTRLPHRSKRFLNCVHHLQASPAADVTLHIQERNFPPTHHAFVEIFIVSEKAPF